jgi:hypothetical protein
MGTFISGEAISEASMCLYLFGISQRQRVQLLTGLTSVLILCTSSGVSVVLMGRVVVLEGTKKLQFPI